MQQITRGSVPLMFCTDCYTTGSCNKPPTCFFFTQLIKVDRAMLRSIPICFCFSELSISFHFLNYLTIQSTGEAINFLRRKLSRRLIPFVACVVTNCLCTRMMVLFDRHIFLSFTHWFNIGFYNFYVSPWRRCLRENNRFTFKEVKY